LQSNSPWQEARKGEISAGHCMLVDLQWQLILVITQLLQLNWRKIHFHGNDSHYSKEQEK
jgi:hypothetical protein